MFLARDKSKKKKTVNHCPEFLSIKFIQINRVNSLAREWRQSYWFAIFVWVLPFFSF